MAGSIPSPSRIAALLALQTNCAEAAEALRFIQNDGVSLNKSSPIIIETSEALRIWETRQKNMQSTGKCIYGLNDLVVSLKNLDRKQTVYQYGFYASNVGGGVFFLSNNAQLLIGFAVSFPAEDPKIFGEANR